MLMLLLGIFLLAVTFLNMQASEKQIRRRTCRFKIIPYLSVG